LKTLILCKRVGRNELYQALEQPNGQFEVTRQGGGFVVSVFPNRAAFDLEYAETTPDPTLKRGTVTADFLPENVSLPCYSNGLFWNGWGMPLFDEETTHRVVQLCNTDTAPDVSPTLKWADGVLQEYDGNEETYHPCAVAEYVVDDKAVRLWQIGDGWTWNAVEFDATPPQTA
jgi:hypothetical protein